MQYLLVSGMCDQTRMFRIQGEALHMVVELEKEELHDQFVPKRQIINNNLNSEQMKQTYAIVWKKIPGIS